MACEDGAKAGPRTVWSTTVVVSSSLGPLKGRLRLATTKVEQDVPSISQMRCSAYSQGAKEAPKVMAIGARKRCESSGESGRVGEREEIGRLLSGAQRSGFWQSAGMSSVLVQAHRRLAWDEGASDNLLTRAGWEARDVVGERNQSARPERPLKDRGDGGKEKSRRWQLEAE